MPRNTSRANGAKRLGTKSLKRTKVRRGKASDNPDAQGTRPPGLTEKAVEVIKLIALLRLVTEELNAAQCFSSRIGGKEYTALRHARSHVEESIALLTESFVPAQWRRPVNNSLALARTIHEEGSVLP